MYRFVKPIRLRTASKSLLQIGIAFLSLQVGAPLAMAEDEIAPTPCFESRKGASELLPQELATGLPSVKCSPTTGGVLWWSDPYNNTVPMGDINLFEGQTIGEAVVRPRKEKMALFPICGIACHNGFYPPVPKNKDPRLLTMHMDIVPNSLDLQHGNKAMWCLDCHNATQRNTLIDNFGNSIDFNEPQKLCGKCHGSVYRDWRDGIHGKRIGEWASGGKKRWFVCTECHDPHDVQQGDRHSGFAKIAPELAPQLPKGMDNFDHELKNADGTWKEKYLPSDDE